MLLDGLHLLGSRLSRIDVQDFPVDLSCQKNRFWQRGQRIGRSLRQVPEANEKRTGVDVMILIFCNYCQLSAKKWRFSQKPIL
jgi:hypothetical protein